MMQIPFRWSTQPIEKRLLRVASKVWPNKELPWEITQVWVRSKCVLWKKTGVEQLNESANQCKCCKQTLFNSLLPKQVPKNDRRHWSMTTLKRMSAKLWTLKDSQKTMMTSSWMLKTLLSSWIDFISHYLMSGYSYSVPNIVHHMRLYSSQWLAL